MDGFQSFVKMQEIDNHISQDVEWWRGEGLSLALIATVLRQVAERVAPQPVSWPEHWDAHRPRSARAP